MKKLFYLIAALASVCINVNGQRVFPEMKYSEGTLGKALQPFFVSFCGSCGFFQQRKLEKFESSRDFIVWDVRNLLSLCGCRCFIRRSMCRIRWGEGGNYERHYY